MRVSELFTERQKSEKHVVGLKDVDEVIAIMGQPEDYKIDDEDTETASANYNSSQSRKLYRDTDNGMIGGVLAGLGHYFGVDKVWLRIIMLVFLFVFGTGALAYFILWIVMPEAKTTAEKLEMTGEPVTISNIEKKVREEFENVSEKFKNADYDKFGNKVKSGAEKIGSTFGNLVILVLKAFSKFLGILLILSGIATMVLLFIAVFTLGSSSFISVPWQDFIEAGNFTDYPVWCFGLIMFFAVGIPFFFLTLLGFKLLSPNMKSIGNIAKYTLLAIWLISVSLSVAVGIKQASAFANDGRVVQKETINLNPTDTLFIKFEHNDFFAKNVEERTDFKITQDSTKTDVIYSNNVSFRIEKTDANLPYIQVEKEAKGKTMSEAKLRAEQIKYSYKIVGNHLVMDNYLLSDLKEKFRDQEIEITLFIPKNTLFKVDSNIRDYDRSDNDYFNLHYSSSDYIYKVGSTQVKCLNCPIDENEYNDIENNQETDSVVTTTVTVNGEVIKVNKTGNKKGLSINKDGIVIKTN
jgi:phage shock protein PspC (stress-responsive transcriptional regulator)